MMKRVCTIFACPSRTLLDLLPSFHTLFYLHRLRVLDKKGKKTWSELDLYLSRERGWLLSGSILVLDGQVGSVTPKRRPCRLQTADCRPCRPCRLCRLSTFFLTLVFLFTFDSHFFQFQLQNMCSIYPPVCYLSPSYTSSVHVWDGRVIDLVYFTYLNKRCSFVYFGLKLCPLLTGLRVFFDFRSLPFLSYLVTRKANKVGDSTSFHKSLSHHKATYRITIKTP